MKKLVFLLLFTTLLFLLARMLEFIAWYETGLLMMKLVDPLSLSVRKLKSLLDGRGLSYEGVVDKAELTNLVKASGEVVEGEVLMLEQDIADGESNAEMTTTFSSKAQFDEEVEDKKDSVWLVQVVPRNYGPLLGRTAWSTVVKKLSRFGIRHGSFDCSIDPRICAQKNWDLPLLLLAMPQGHRHKDHVTMAAFTSAGKAQQIIKWVNSQLANKVQLEKRRSDEIFAWDEKSSKQVPVRLVLFSKNREPPLFFSALNLKYSGRVKFVFVSIRDDSIDRLGQDDQLQEFPLPSLVVATPEGKKVYGLKPGEYQTYKALDIYLKTLTPEANDIFVLTFMNVNIICVIGLFVIQGGIAKRICQFIWTIGKYNITVLLLWLPLLGIIQLPCLSPVLEYSYKAIRLGSETWLMGKLRQDWLMYSGHSYVVLILFLFYCFVVHLISKKIHSPTSEDGMTSGLWLRASLVDFYSFLLRPSPSFRSGLPRNDHLEEGLDLLIEQMAVPDLWLHPKTPADYIKDLQTWRYSCDWLQQHPSSSNDNDSSDSEKGHSACRKKCSELSHYVLNSRLDCKCKSDMFSSSVVQRKDSENAGACGDNMFVVRPNEKPVCSQPEPLSQSGSKNISSFFSNSNPNLQEAKILARSEAQLNDSSSMCKTNDAPPREKAHQNVDTEQCCGCSHGEQRHDSTSEKQTEPETLGANCKPDKVHEKEKESNYTPVTPRKTSPKRHANASKPKPSPRKKPRAPNSDAWPEGVLFNSQCAICIESYTHGVTVCSLPCGHAYHWDCIVAWLKNGNHMCPICRWPAYKKRGYKLSKHME